MNIFSTENKKYLRKYYVFTIICIENYYMIIFTMIFVNVYFEKKSRTLFGLNQWTENDFRSKRAFLQGQRSLPFR